MKNMKIISIAGILIFCGLVVWGCVPDYLLLFVDPVSFIFVTVGGCALAFAKMPKNINEFLKYFSKTSLLSGVLGTVIGFINSFGLLDFTTPGIPASVGVSLSVAPITTFYGLIFSGISYALYCDEPK